MLDCIFLKFKDDTAFTKCLIYLTFDVRNSIKINKIKCNRNVF